jgi:sortase A
VRRPVLNETLVWIQRVLLVAGAVLLGYWGYAQARSHIENAALDRRLERMLQTEPAEQPEQAPKEPEVFAEGELLGRIEAPRVGVSTVILHGVSDPVLSRAAGHIPGTVRPGAEGNSAIAAHRDSFFRGLKDIRSGDEITVTRPDGIFTYRVTATEVVEPEDIHVLDPTSDARLTLVTCYPFNYVGAAPQRFIVVAARDEPPGAAGTTAR